jgi:NADPH:quinone reductase
MAHLTSTTVADVPLAAVRQGGKVSTTTMAPDQDAPAAVGLTGTGIMAKAVRETTGPLAEQAAAGQLTIDVETVLPLEQAAEGLATIASGNARGKIVVTVAD